MTRWSPKRSLLWAAALTLTSAPALAFDHGPLDRLLHKHVEAGRVAYAGIKAHGRAELDGYVRSLGSADLSGMSKPRQLAFYLNAYNALVIKSVVERYPLGSVKKVPGFFKRIKHRVAGRSLTLDELEHKVIRPTFKDARIHFALVCAARGCPPLRAAAFYGSSVDRVLDRLAKNFINSWQGVRVQGDTVKVSQLFNWFADDFKRDAGSVGHYLARYHRRHAKQLARTKHFEYLPYDWALNNE